MSKWAGLVPMTVRQLWMFKKHIRLASWYTKLARQPGESRQEVYQASLEGLMRAVQGYDPERGIKFGYYSRIWMRAKVQRMRLQRSRAAMIYPERHASVPGEPKLLPGCVSLRGMRCRRTGRWDRDHFEAILSVVDPRSRRILRERFVGGREWQDIAREEGISKQRLRQLMDRAFPKLEEEARRLRGRDQNSELANELARR